MTCSKNTPVASLPRAKKPFFLTESTSTGHITMNPKNICSIVHTGIKDSHTDWEPKEEKYGRGKGREKLICHRVEKNHFS